MFIEFQVGNFRSFRDIQKLSMIASPKRSNDAGLDERNVIEQGDLRLLRTKAIYGGNASGKSNLIKALAAFCLMVERSVSEEGLPKRFWERRFALITDWDDQPVFFQYIYSVNSEIFRYGFQILQGIVSSEWLFMGEKDQEIRLFYREGDSLAIEENQFTGAEKFTNQEISKDNELFRPDSLFLTAAALTGNKFAASMRSEIRSMGAINGLNDSDTLVYAMHKLEKGTEEDKVALRKLLYAADTGVEDIEIREMEDSQGKLTKAVTEGAINNDAEIISGLFSIHSRYDENGKVVDKINTPFREWESEGTMKLFTIGSLILTALKRGSFISIDEFDARLHPNLTLKIVNLFNNPTTNPKNAQLIFVTHDTGLLRRAELRRDQICLVNKDKYGISEIKTLIEFKGVRKDSSFEKEYLNGSYTAVPYLDQLDWIITESFKHD